MPFGLFSQRDPWWEIDGPAARRERRRQRLVALVAFAASLTAFSGATYAWAIHLGIVALRPHIG
jgi:hypothetical protein